jgi:hypothetical protein
MAMPALDILLVDVLVDVLLRILIPITSGSHFGAIAVIVYKE